MWFAPTRASLAVVSRHARDDEQVELETGHRIFVRPKNCALQVCEEGGRKVDVPINRGHCDQHTKGLSQNRFWCVSHFWSRHFSCICASYQRVLLVGPYRAVEQFR